MADSTIYNGYWITRLKNSYEICPVGNVKNKQEFNTRRECMDAIDQINKK